MKSEKYTLWSSAPRDVADAFLGVDTPTHWGGVVAQAPKGEPILAAGLPVVDLDRADFHESVAELDRKPLTACGGTRRGMANVAVDVAVDAPRSAESITAVVSARSGSTLVSAGHID